MSRRDKKEVAHDDISSRVERNSREMDILVNTIVDKFCKPLDDYIESISELLSDNDRKHIPDEKLDSIVLNLPTLLYFASTAQESLGIREDMAKSIRNELFNRVRENAKGTIADKNAAAELAAMQETLVWSVYQRAYKIVKCKVEGGYELLASVKKVISRRSAEYSLSAGVGGQRYEEQ